MLRLIRRHVQACKHRSTRYRRCGCPIHVYGTLAGEKIRKALDLTSWEAATDLIREWEASGVIGMRRVEVPTIAEAVEKFMADAEARNLKPESLKKQKDAIERLFLGFSESRRLTEFRHVDVDVIREFRNEIVKRFAPNSARGRLQYVRSFFRFCQNSGWLVANPALAVKHPKPDNAEVETFTPGEVERMLAAAEKFNHRGIFGAGNRKRIRAMILLLRYSGLRISDASTLAREKLAGDKLRVRTLKTGAHVWLPLPPQVVQALHESPSDNPKYFFWNGNCLPTSTVKIWERTFERVFELGKVPEQKRFLHNFRHSFASDLLSRGVSVENVAALLGNTPTIVTKHYSHWILARQESLEAAVRKLWTEGAA